MSRHRAYVIHTVSLCNAVLTNQYIITDCMYGAVVTRIPLTNVIGFDSSLVPHRVRWYSCHYAGQVGSTVRQTFANIRVVYHICVVGCNMPIKKTLNGGGYICSFRHNPCVALVTHV